MYPTYWKLPARTSTSGPATAVRRALAQRLAHRWPRAGSGASRAAQRGRMAASGDNIVPLQRLCVAMLIAWLAMPVTPAMRQAALAADPLNAPRTASADPAGQASDETWEEIGRAHV